MKQRHKAASSQEPLSQRAGALAEQPRSVLAVVAIAAVWPERFPGGWVTQSHVAEHSRHFERSGRGPSEANRIGFVRARKIIREAFADLAPEQRLVGGVAAIRIHADGRDDLRNWVVTEAPALVERSFWNGYLAPYEPWEHWLAAAECVAATTIRRDGLRKSADFVMTLWKALPTTQAFSEELGEQSTFMEGFFDIFGTEDIALRIPTAALIEAARSSAARYDQRYLRRHLRYVLATVALDLAATPVVTPSPPHEAARAIGVAYTCLKQMDLALPIRVPADRLLVGRIHLAWARLSHAIQCHRGFIASEQLLQGRRDRLNHAATYLDQFGYDDRSRFALYAGTLAMAEARTTSSYANALSHMTAAEAHIRDSVALATASREFGLVSVGLQYLAATIFQRSVLDGGAAMIQRRWIVELTLEHAKAITTGADPGTLDRLAPVMLFDGLYRTTRSSPAQTEVVSPEPQLQLSLDWMDRNVGLVFALRRRDYACFGGEVAPPVMP